MPHWRELRLLVSKGPAAEALVWSRLFRGADARVLREYADGTLADFEHHG